MDIGASTSINHDSFVRINKFNTRKTPANKWSTMAVSISMSCKAEVKMKPPELKVTAHIFAPFHINSQKSNNNVIFGQDLLQKLGMNIDFQKQLRWLERNEDTHEIN